jgi:hypothetical protein
MTKYTPQSLSQKIICRGVDPEIGEVPNHTDSFSENLELKFTSFLNVPKLENLDNTIS